MGLQESFPDMPFASLEEQLLDEALAMTPDARAGWLEVLARDAPGLAARLEAVLFELEAADGFLLPGGALGGVLFAELREGLADDPAPPPTLAEGDEVGPYRVVSSIAAGGMGEVYRAHDPKLGRDVAIKVLPAHRRGQRDRLRRLRREARVLAALNHPNIATIYELEEFGETLALVLELVEGPTLAERLVSGPLPVAEAIAIARQLVDALDAAHTRGVVHRDLKPTNLKVTGSGLLKVLDFGIATVLRDATGTDASSLLLSRVTASQPLHAVLGTVAYMSPEQLRGEAVDQRADVWAFGCVLCEMLTGARAFPGASAAEVMSGVLRHDPDVSQLPATTPESLRLLVERCLVKDPAARLARITEARPLLDGAVNPSASAAPARPRAVRGLVQRLPGTAWPLALGLLVGAAVSGAAVWTALRPAPRPVARLTVPIPSGDELVTGALPAVALSPDGSTIVYRALRDGQLQLFVRTLAGAAPRPLAGTVNAAAPFFSPDGAWVGFDQDGVLMKVPVAGGRPAKICDTGGAGSAASWGDLGDIVFAPTPGRGLFRTSAAGGSPVTLTRLDETRGDVSHGLPHLLPGGRAAIFTIEDHDTSRVAAVRLDTGDVRLLTEGRQATYASSGHILVIRGDTVWAAPFDVDGLRLEADPMPVLRGLDAVGAAQLALARNGSLVYVPRRELDSQRDLTAARRQRQLRLIQNWVSELDLVVPGSR